MHTVNLGLTAKQENGERNHLKVEALKLGLNSICPGEGTLLALVKVLRAADPRRNTKGVDICIKQTAPAHKGHLIKLRQ